MSGDLSLSLSEAEASSLTEAALHLDQARQSGDRRALAAALDNNVKVWTAIRTVAGRPDVDLPETVRINLGRLADFVASATLAAGTGVSEEVINTLININFQISEGLLEGRRESRG